MNAKNQIIRATFFVFCFWWLVCTLYELGGSPRLFFDNWPYVGYTVSRWALGSVSGLIVGVWCIWFSRTLAINKLYMGKHGNRRNGVRSTLGDVPMPSSALKRIDSSSKRLPINSQQVNDWLAASQKQFPLHVAFFWAIWDTYSAHAQYPASHRKGGHGNRRLWEHCLAVADTALTDAAGYVFDGVFLKARGKPKFKIIDLKNKEYRFDAQDPLIPILALAHDIGKLEAYVLAEDGTVITKEGGSALTPQDDNRISHDSLGARILARFPEYWALPARDRTAINLVIAHYHHPSQFPVDRNGLSLDDRLTALMEFLILVDKKTGMAESNITENLNEQEITEEESSTIYHSFVDIITEYGRVNGTGDRSKDSTLKIAQKHDGLIVVKEKDLRMLLLAKLGWSLDEGDGRYRVTLNLLGTLQEKGVLYTTHNHADMARFLPMFSASFRDPQTGAHVTTWEPVIIFRPVSTTPELADLSGLPNLSLKLDIERPLFTHNPGIQDVDTLRSLIAQAFGAEIASKATIAGKQERAAAGPEASITTEEPTPATPPANAATSPSTEPAPNVVTALSPEQPVERQDVGTSTEDLARVTPADTKDESPEGAKQVATLIEDPQMAMPGDDDEIPIDDLEQETAGLLDHQEADNDDAEFMAFVGDAAGTEDQEDPFGDFDAAPVTDSLPPTQLAHVPEEQCTASHVLSTPPIDSPEPVSPIEAKPMAIAIIDPDAQPTRRKLSPAAEAAALKALSDNTPDFTTFVQPRKKKRSVQSGMKRLREAIANKTIPICGSREGFNYVLETDIIAFDAELDISAIVKAEKLPTVSPKPGITMIGLPVIDSIENQ